MAVCSQDAALRSLPAKIGLRRAPGGSVFLEPKGAELRKANFAIGTGTVSFVVKLDQ